MHAGRRACVQMSFQFARNVCSANVGAPSCVAPRARLHAQTNSLATQAHASQRMAAGLIAAAARERVGEQKG